MRSLRRLSVLALASVFWPGASTATLQDSAFTETPWVSVDSGSLGVSGLAWAPDGSNRLFWLRQDGEVRIIKNGVALATPFATMSPIRTGGEEGLIGIAFDPNFVDSGYVYVFVTSQNGNSEILRYTAVGDTGMQRTVLKTNLPEGGNHNGGGIGFGPDGKLYWGIGEAGQNVPLTDLATLNSKIGRMNPDGTAPNDNPFVGGSNNPYIWARGFRNPYTMTFQPSTEKLWVNVVGTAAEQIFLVDRGDHAGYVQGDRETEGSQAAPYIQPVLDYWEGTGETPQIASATRADGIVTVTLTSAHHLYKPGRRVRVAGMPTASFNTSPPYPPILDIPSPTQFRFAQAGANASVTGNGNSFSNVTGLGRVVLGGTFYDATAFPPAYRGNYFWGDFGSGNVMRAVMGGASENKFATVDVFSTNIDQYIDAAVGPDGALYYVTYGGQIYRVAYKQAAQAIVLSKQHVRMNEGGRAVVMASLAVAPAGGVTVNVARQDGDTDLTVSGGATLTFTSSNWNVPQPVTIASAVDGDSTEDVANFVASSTGLSPQSFVVKATDTNNQALVVSTSTLNLNEGASGTFTVALSRAPTSNVVVTVGRSSGSTDVSVSGGASLTFTPANFGAQTVTIAAANDVDEDDETATVTINPGSGISPRNVAVNVRDSALKAPKITSQAPGTAVAGAPYTYAVKATGNPDPTFALVAPVLGGMTINTTSGVLGWTPPSVGNFTATVRASNGVGTAATQTFTIKVAADQAPTAVLTQPKEGETISGAKAEFYGDGVDDVFCPKAEFFVDGVLKYTDQATRESHFHMNGGHAQFDTFDYPNGPHKLKMAVTDTSGKTGQVEVNVIIANDGGRPESGTDAGTGPGTPTPENDAGAPAASAADDSGCSASPRAASSFGLLFGLAGLLAAIGRRRRRA